MDDRDGLESLINRKANRFPKSLDDDEESGDTEDLCGDPDEALQGTTELLKALGLYENKIGKVLVEAERDAEKVLGHVRKRRDGYHRVEIG